MPSRCDPQTDRCRSYKAGHQVHFIQARLAGEQPWHWRDGVVAEVDGHTLTVQYSFEEGDVDCWSHHDLSSRVEVGDTVRVHERFNLLAAGRSWICVECTGGLGPVPRPDHPELWSTETSPGIVDLATGEAIATDRP